MVCLGNICRSPLAEGILKSKVNPEKVEVDSAGTSNYHVGDSPDPRSIDTAKRYNLDISKQRGRQFEVSDFDEFDHIFVMDQSNYADVVALARNEKDKEKVALILEKIYPNEFREVPDPYFGKGDEGFEKVFQLLDQACDRIAKGVF
ncbi:MAG TPA: low molecular weight protein-tyrosine-phosphatase [Flavobacteriaceae bacterium]|nr:low molecular weight protein-tyrosine-phosphatase [Flavobacteriaceae bacterium]